MLEQSYVFLHILLLAPVLPGDMGDSQIGLQARLMSKALRKLTGSLAKSQVSTHIPPIQHFYNVLPTEV